LLAAALLVGGLLSVAVAERTPLPKAAAADHSIANTDAGQRPASSHGSTNTLPDYVRPAPGQHRTPFIGPDGDTATDDLTTNWAGLVETGSSSYTSVSASWTVPTVQPSENLKVSATWIGIDGFNNQHLIQTGTEQDTSGGVTSYDAWWEILPAPETPITTITVSAGDVMSASITQDSPGTHSTPGTWTITITDETTGKGFTQAFAYGGSDGQPANSAEWIEEQTGVSPQAPLADFGTADFSGLAYVTPDAPHNVPTLIYMENNSGVVDAYPTQPDDTDLTVTYGQPPSQTSVMANPNSVEVTTSITYSASVTTDVEGLPTPTGSVTFSVGSTVLCTAPLSNGAGSCSSKNAPSGSDTVAGAYSGDDVFLSSAGSTNITVTPATPGLSTSFTAPSSNSVGNAWTDSATVMGDSTGLAPTGSVSFTWCEVVSPNTSCTGTGGGGGAGTLSVPSVSGDNSTFGPSTSVSPSSPGTYCFNASYTAPTGGYYASVAQQSDTECFSVTAATPGLTTLFTAPSSNSLGNSWTDSATVSGNSTGLAPTGSVSFTWCEVVSPNTSCTGTSGGGTAGTLTVPSVSGDNSTFGPSTSVTPSTVGTYCFNASYAAPMGGAYVSVAQQSDTECFTVATSTPGFTTSFTAPSSNTVGNTWTDSATVFGDSTGLAPTGSVSFTWCEEVSPGTPCTGTSGGGTAGTSSVPGVSGDNSTFGPSNSVTPSNVGTYCFNASYSAPTGGYYASVAQQSDNECFSVTAATPGFTTLFTAPSSNTVGNTWTDSATVAGNSTGLAPTGSVSFTWCEVVSPNPSCTGTGGGGTAGTSSIPSVNGDNSTFGPSTSVTPSSVGTYCFDASYTAPMSGNYVSVAQQSDTECFSVTAATPGFTTSITAPSSNTVGNTWTDSATVFGNSTGLAPTGSVSFTWCEVVSSNTSCTGTGGGGTAGTSSTPRVSGDNSTFGPSTSVAPSSAGTYCFNASYTATTGGNYVSVAQQSDTECFTVAAVPPPPPPPPPLAPVHGYWLVGSDGGIFTFGSAQFHGSTGSLKLQRPVVGIVPTNDRNGYWLDASDGGIFAFGDAGFYGSIPGLGLNPAGSGLPHSLNAPIVGMVPSSDGNGYFMVASDGGVFAFGDAHFAGSCPGIGGCSGAAVAVMPDASGNGYWLVTATGSIYTFGDAPYEGAPGNTGSPVTSAVRTPDGKGYWILTANGTVYPFGDAGNFGSPAGQLGGLNPATAVFATSDGGGYWVVSANGTVQNFGDAPNDGGMNGTNLNGSIIAATGW
jgi:hypothetical protein